jgi:hypothetical protein
VASGLLVRLAPRTQRAFQPQPPGNALGPSAPQLSGTINLTGGELDITDAVRIQGPGRDQLTVSVGGLSRVFSVFGTRGEHCRLDRHSRPR